MPEVEIKPLRIGVVGAGLVGSFAALALSQLPNAKVVVFEKSSVAREAGAWISLTVTGLKVLTQLIPSQEINDITYRSSDRAVYVTRHWRTGKILLRRYSSEHLKNDYIQGRTHRPPLLRVLQKHVPPGVIQYNHKTVGMNIQSDEVQLEVEREGLKESHNFDLVVAADGIYSRMRTRFWPDHQVTYKGAVAYRTVFPKSKLEGITGLHDDSSAWRKNGDVVFLSELGLGMYGVVIIRQEDPDYASKLQWEHSIGDVGIKRLQGLYKDWDAVICRVLNVVGTIEAYPLESGPWLRQLAQQEKVAFVGDAAHPTAGAFGAGAAMGFGDCWALYRALEVCGASKGAGFVTYDVPRALKIFEESRAPFLARVEKQITIEGANAIYIGEAGDDETEWIRRFKDRNPPNHWLVEHDAELEVQKVIASERSLL